MSLLDIVPCDYSGICPYAVSVCEDLCGEIEQKGEEDNEEGYLLQTVKEL